LVSDFAGRTAINTVADEGERSLHPTRGRITIDAIGTMLTWHDDNHLDQLRRALEGKA
jgi:hypothetical protein